MSELLDFFGLGGVEEGPSEGGENRGADNVEVSDEMEIDDQLSVIDRVKKYAKSDLVLHRLYIVRELADAVRSISFDEAKTHLVPVMEEILNDAEPVVRQALVEQVPDVTKYFIEGKTEAGYTVVLHILLPMVAELTTDRNAQVRAAAVESLESLAKMVRHEDIESYLLPIIKSLSNDATEEEHRVEAVTILHNLAPVFGAEICSQVVLPLIVRLSEDGVFRVRKAVAANLGNICRTVGVEATTQYLLPVFVTLSQDEIWGVRKGCAESLVAMAGCVSSIERYSNLIEVFERLAEDQSRWVRSSAYQNLGAFIATFEGQQVTPKLLRYYTGMVSDAVSTKYGDIDITTFCAYSFPAVLQTVGGARWGELSDTYFTLVNELQWKVRRTLAHSLHEVARILGPQITESALLPALDLFLRDLDEVRIGVITHIAEFLQVVPEPLRERYLPTIADIQTDSGNWRFRKLLAKQIGTLSGLFSEERAVQTIIPMSLQLLRDNVYAVRKTTAAHVGPLVSRFWGSNCAPTIVNPIKEFATDPSFNMRQMYPLLCGHLVDQISNFAFETTFMPSLLSLAHDKVPNVRFELAKTLTRHLLTNEYFSEFETVLSTIAKLKKDKDRDVVNFASQITKKY